MILKRFLLVSTALAMTATVVLTNDVDAQSSETLEETKLAALTGAESTLAQPELLKVQKLSLIHI